MAVPRHLFANLLDELGGVRRKLEGQAKARAARGLNRLIEENTLPGSREKSVPASADVWPPPTPKGGGRDLDAPDMSGISGSSGMGETRRVSRRDAPTVLLVREGSAAVTLSDGTRLKAGAGEVLVCGVPRRGIPRITKVTAESKAKVVEVPLESFRKGGLFSSPAALDAFLRVLSVGFHDVSE
ncbi:unnamed protein product [Ectocarpus fasciculatus]